MRDSIQSPSNTVLIIAILALIIIGLLCCGCITGEVVTPKNCIEKWAREQAKSEDRRLMKEIESRLLPEWVADLPKKAQRNWKTVTAITTVAGSLGFGIRHKAHGTAKKVSNAHRQEKG